MANRDCDSSSQAADEARQIGDEDVGDDSDQSNCLRLVEIVDALDVFHRALQQLQVENDRLIGALERRDSIEVEIAMWDLACVWSSTREAAQAVRSVTPPATPELDSTEHAMAIAYHAVFYIVGTAITMVSSWTPRMPELLQTVCRTAMQMGFVAAPRPEPGHSSTR
jgi:hypothetical protein